MVPERLASEQGKAQEIKKDVGKITILLFNDVVSCEDEYKYMGQRLGLRGNSKRVV